MPMKFPPKFEQAYNGFRRVASMGQSPLLLLVRLYWGWQFMQTGWGKFQHLDRVAEFFATLGLPMPGVMAPFIASVEFFGGLLLLLGLASRLTGLVLTGNMIVAYLTAHTVELGSIFSDPEKFYNAAPYTFLFASLLVLLFGPGCYALDTLVRRWCATQETAPERAP